MDWVPCLISSRCCINSCVEVWAAVVSIRFLERFFLTLATATCVGALALRNTAFIASPTCIFMLSISAVGFEQGITIFSWWGGIVLARRVSVWGVGLAVLRVLGMSFALLSVALENSMCAAGGPIHGCVAVMEVEGLRGVGGSGRLC
jgi:hypothetical protein